MNAGEELSTAVTMLRAFVCTLIVGTAGALIGLAVAGVAILSGQVLSLDYAWTAAVCGSIGGYAGAIVGLVGGATQALAGGGLNRRLLLAALGALLGAAAAHSTGGSKPGGWLLVGAGAGAMLGGLAVVARSWWMRRKTRQLTEGPPRRCWLQFRLRGLLIAIFLLSALLGLGVSRPVRQRRAVAALEARQAQITLEHKSGWIESVAGESLPATSTVRGCGPIKMAKRSSPGLHATPSGTSMWRSSARTGRKTRGIIRNFRNGLLLFMPAARNRWKAV